MPQSEQTRVMAALRRGSLSSFKIRYVIKEARLAEPVPFLFYNTKFFSSPLYCCSGTGAAHTGHVASLIPRLPTHRSSHSRQQARWNAWPHASCIRGLPASKGSRQVGHESSSSSSSAAAEAGCPCAGFASAAAPAFGPALLEGRGGAAMALEGGPAAAPADTAADAAAAELSALESSGVPSRLLLLLLLFRRCCLRPPPPRSPSLPRSPPAAPAAAAAAAATEEEEEEEAEKPVSTRPSPPPLAVGDSGGDSGLGGGLYCGRLWCLRSALWRDGDATRAREPLRLRVSVLREKR